MSVGDLVRYVVARKHRVGRIEELDDGVAYVRDLASGEVCLTAASNLRPV